MHAGSSREFGLREKMLQAQASQLPEAALPLGAAAYASGDRTILTINVGILIVVAIALGVTAAGNAANMLEGLNGLGAGLGVIVTFTLIVLSLEKGAEEGLFLLFPLFGALVAF